MLVNYIPQLIGSLVTLIAATAIRFIINRLTKKYVETHANYEIRANLANRIITMFINTASLMIIIVIWGVDTKNLFLALSSVFTVIGVALFAQWSVLSNVTAGVIIFFTSTFRIGNYIRILDKDLPIEARVEDIFTFYTHLRTKEGDLLVYPNNLFLQKAVSVLNEETMETDHSNKQTEKTGK